MKRSCQDEGRADELFREEFLLEAPGSRKELTPLSGAVFSGNPKMFKKVLTAFCRGVHGDGGINSGGSSDGSDGGGCGSSETSDCHGEFRVFPKDEIVLQVEKVLSIRSSGRGKKERAPEVRLLLRACRGPGVFKDVVESAEWTEFIRVVEKAEWDHCVSKAKRASVEGTFDGLRYRNDRRR